MSNLIGQLEQIEQKLLSDQLTINLNEPLFCFKDFKKHEAILLSTVRSYISSDDLDFRRAGVCILLASNIKESALLYPLFMVMREMDDYDLRAGYKQYLLDDPEKLIDFLYGMAQRLPKEDIDLYIELLMLKDQGEYPVLALFLLETYTLEEHQVRRIYQYLMKNEGELKSLEAYYQEGKLFTDFINQLPGNEKLTIGYADIKDKTSLIHKRLPQVNSLGYFYNKDQEAYQIWIKLDLANMRLFDNVSAIDFNATIHYPKNLMLHFQFETEGGTLPFKLDLYLGNGFDRDFLSFLLKEKAIQFILIDDEQEIRKAFDFIFTGPVLYKLLNQSFISYHFRDFEWLKIKGGIEFIGGEDLVNIDVPVSVFRKIHRDYTLFDRVLEIVHNATDIVPFMKRFRPVFYTEQDHEVFNNEELETLVRAYIRGLDRHYPYLLLYITGSEHARIKYLSYLLPTEFTDADLQSVLVRRLFFIARYLHDRGIIFYDILVEIAKDFKIELPEKFMNKLADAIEVGEELPEGI